MVDAQQLHKEGYCIKSHFSEGDAGVLIVETWADPELSGMREEWLEILLKKDGRWQDAF